MGGMGAGAFIKMVLGTAIIGTLVWLFFSSGVATAFSFSSVPWYAWAVIILLLFLWFTRKK